MVGHETCIRMILFYIFQPKQTEVIYQFVMFHISRLPIRRVSKDKIAFNQCQQSIRKSSSQRKSRLTGYLFTSITGMTLGEQTNDLLAIFRIAEYGIEQAIELILQTGFLSEKNSIGISLKTQPLLEITEIIRNTPEDHVRLDYIVTGHRYPFVSKIFLTLLQCERRKLDFIRKPSIQSSPIAGKIAKNPRGGTTTHHEHQIVTPATPPVPKAFESRKKSRTGRVHPRQFIDENNLPGAVIKRNEQLFQLKERLHPRFGFLETFQSMVQQRIIETFQLGLHSISFPFLVNRRHPRMLEGDATFQCLLDEESLPYTSSAIYSHKLGTFATIEFFQLFHFTSSSNYCTHDAYILPQI